MADNHNDGNPARVWLRDDAYLRTIDKLRDLGIADLIPFPQIVAVSDQSSGKSSVLKSVTGFAFPRGPELCTRYATQITCRRDASESVQISIIPSQNSDKDRKERLKEFGFSVEKNDLVLADVFAKVTMALRSINDGDASKLPTFAEDILKIEISSPDQHHLTIIDVPGIFRTSTKGLTTDSDIAIVRGIVNRYIQDQRTIILAVIPCNVDTSTQEALTLAKEVDPEGLRTMVVLTKPDLATERVTQRIVCELVEGRRHPLRLGYCVVKNRSGDEEASTTTDPNSLEKAFFSARPWIRIRSTFRVGVSGLALRLRDLLGDLSKKEHKNVEADIRRRLNNTETLLKRLGPSRPRPDAQRRYLSQIASGFQEVCLRARDGNYIGMDIFHHDVHFRLITCIINLNETFNKEKVGPGPAFKVPMDVQSTRCLVDILKHMDFECPKPVEGLLLSRIEFLFHRSRNAEIGSFPGSLLAQAFKEQTQKWEPLVLKHVSQVIVVVHKFIRITLQRKCDGDSNTFEMLHNHLLLPKLRAAYQRALDHAQFLLEVELSGQPYTMNHYFDSDLQVSQAARLQQAINKVIGPESVRNVDGATASNPSPNVSPASGGNTLGANNNNGSPFDFTSQQEDGSSGAAGWWVPKSMLSKLTTDRYNAEQVREDIHDALRSYYMVARRRFVDIVLQQVIFHFLLDSKTSPLKIFTPDLIMSLDDTQLKLIAGENAATRDRREILTKNILNSKLALEELKKTK
ncbi:P-loop containing nucleoside triphosphate hydrolase protein [Colletotrichum acutatum]|uniref:P-loop containing nucleoside triphosphate hydrolase protein n=1 Tax=Glomerella acutata TaxID=27357 RepID=A0AAD9CYY2_GLOAC|nr:P-loop containing nucleoside triphosphate hydrolase protein [Colletotrichum acutatum]KAK1729022.1 P-loop containing nucleoside triphosphate hydrolase protein [Colletotrichum acutatum]